MEIKILPEWTINKFSNEIQFQAKYAMIFSQLFPRLRGLAWHTPNEGYITQLEKESDEEYRKRCAIEGNRFKAQGVLSGVSDWIFRWNGIMYIQELKQPGKKLSDKQVEFFQKCTRDCPENPPVIIYTIAQGIEHTQKVLERNLKIDIR